LVAGPGIEPGTGAYETPEMPLLHPAIDKKFNNKKDQIIYCSSTSVVALASKA
jgi:hypothetical protein